MKKDVRLYNIVEKDRETRFIMVKNGCFFSLTYDNIDQLKVLFDEIEKGK